MAHRPTIAFDLDGTLVDSAPDLTATLNVILGEAGFGPIRVEQARGMFGAGARALIERGLALHGAQPSAAEIDRLFERFLAYYDAHIADHSRPFPGARAMLEELSAAKAHLVVCTNKLERFAVKLLNAMSLAHFFSVIAGADTFSARKPDPLHILHAVKRAGGEPARTVMVGDSKTDVAAARAARVPVVVVSYGYTDVPATQLGADRVIDHLNEVPTAVAALLDGQATARLTPSHTRP
jgi:phosphoglycolate phosphatase